MDLKMNGLKIFKLGANLKRTRKTRQEERTRLGHARRRSRGDGWVVRIFHCNGSSHVYYSLKQVTYRVRSKQPIEKGA